MQHRGDKLWLEPLEHKFLPDLFYRYSLSFSFSRHLQCPRLRRNHVYLAVFVYCSPESKCNRFLWNQGLMSRRLGHQAKKGYRKSAQSDVGMEGSNVDPSVDY